MWMVLGGSTRKVLPPEVCFLPGTTTTIITTGLAKKIHFMDMISSWTFYSMDTYHGTIGTHGLMKPRSGTHQGSAVEKIALGNFTKAFHACFHAQFPLVSINDFPKA